MIIKKSFIRSNSTIIKFRKALIWMYSKRKRIKSLKRQLHNRAIKNAGIILV